MATFRCDVQKHDQSSVHVFVLDGELDIYSAPKLRETLSQSIAPRNTIVLDCTKLIFIDSTGLGTLVGALKEASTSHGQLSLAGLNDNVRRILSVTGLERLFAIFPTVDAARDATVGGAIRLPN